ncbi:hypothetical protein WN943_025720 [Citrus x changshan-huyou]
MYGVITALVTISYFLYHLQVCIVRKAKPQFTMSSAEEIDDHLTNITKNGAKDDKIAPEIVKDPDPECSLIPGPRQVIQHKVESR